MTTPPGYTTQAQQAMIAAHAAEDTFTDWLITLLEDVATQVGGVETLLTARPTSWQATRVRDMLRYLWHPADLAARAAVTDGE